METHPCGTPLSCQGTVRQGKEFQNRILETFPAARVPKTTHYNNQYELLVQDFITSRALDPNTGNGFRRFMLQERFHDSLLQLGEAGSFGGGSREVEGDGGMGIIGPLRDRAVRRHGRARYGG